MRPPEFLLIDLALGAAPALVTIRASRGMPPAKERRFYAVLLVGAAAVYLVFALRGRAGVWVGVEAAGVAAYGLVAWLGATRSAWWLAAGWLAHVAWDVALHATGATPFVPAFYPMFCVSYDVLVAVYIIRRRKAWRVRARRSDPDAPPATAAASRVAAGAASPASPGEAPEEPPAHDPRQRGEEGAESEAEVEH
ncbi:DUF6010 family protein [Rhodocaloribacter sp.]